MAEQIVEDMLGVEVFRALKRLALRNLMRQNKVLAELLWGLKRKERWSKPGFLTSDTRRKTSGPTPNPC